MIVDSSALIALFVENDEFHTQAVRGFSDSRVSFFIISDRILEETLNVLVYRHGIDFALDVFERINANQRFLVTALSDREHADVVDLMKSLRKKISFQDYLVLHQSLKSGNAPFSFDRQLLALYRSTSR